MQHIPREHIIPREGMITTKLVLELTVSLLSVYGALRLHTDEQRTGQIVPHGTPMVRLARGPNSRYELRITDVHLRSELGNTYFSASRKNGFTY
jgi:hypothetical protein